MEESKKRVSECRPEDPVLEDFFQCSDPKILNRHLSCFVLKTRKSNGERYPPATLHHLLCGLLRHFRQQNTGCPNFMDKKDLRFWELHGTLDVHFHQLLSEGIGRQVQHAEIITKSEENQLWKSGVMGTSTPRSLQNAVFYYVGKLCCLRGGQEHRALKLSQLKRHTNPDWYTYYENVSKNRNGTFKQLHVKEKEVPIYACPEFKATERCPVYLLDMYISKLPPEAVVKYLFYLRPLDVTPTDPTQPWYSSLPVGKHTLNEKVKKMCSMAGIPGRKTNHSLRATEMYESGAPERPPFP